MKPRTKVAAKANEARKGHGAPVAKKPGHKKTPNMFGGVGGYAGVAKKQVRQLVKDSVRPEIQNLRKDRQYVDRQAQDATDDLNTIYDRSVGDINHVFGAAEQKIGQYGANVNDAWTKAQADSQAATQNATSAIQQNSSATAQAIQAELAKLGIAGASQDQIAGLQADGAFASGQATQMGASQQNTLAMQQASANSLTQMLGGMLQGSKTSSLGRAMNSRDAGIAEVGRTAREDKSMINESLAELRKSRPAMFRDLLMQMQAQGFDQWQAIQALNLDAKSLNQNMALARAGMIEDSARYGTDAMLWGSTANAPAPGTGSNGNKTWDATKPPTRKKSKPKTIAPAPGRQSGFLP